MKLSPDMMQERIREISNKSHRMITALDEVVWMMNSKNESLSSFAAYIAAYTVEFLSRTNIVCRIEAPTTYPESAVAAEVRNNVFSSVKEAITNAVRRGEPKRILVKFKVVPDGFEIRIQDDGNRSRKLEIRSEGPAAESFPYAQLQQAKPVGAFHFVSRKYG